MAVRRRIELAEEARGKERIAEAERLGYASVDDLPPNELDWELQHHFVRSVGITGSLLEEFNQ